MECLDGHAAVADVEGDAVSPEGRAFRDQVNHHELACKECVASFQALFDAGL